MTLAHGVVVLFALFNVVGRCRLTLSNPRSKRLEISVLKLEHNELQLSRFAFKVNLRRYDVVCFIAFSFVGVGKFASRFVAGGYTPNTPLIHP